MASGFGEVEMSEARASHVISDRVQTEFVSQVIHACTLLASACTACRVASPSLLFSLQCKRPKASDVQAMRCPVANDLKSCLQYFILGILTVYHYGL